MLFAWEGTPASALERWTRRLLVTTTAVGMFLLPFFGWLAAEPTPYRDPAGYFQVTPPEGWATDDSGHLGPGLVAKGPADAAGAEPVLLLTHEPAGIVTLEVRWQTLLGQLRYDNERLKFISIEEFPAATPPYAQTTFGYQRGGQKYVAVTRLLLADSRFYQMTATAPEAEFELLKPALTVSFDSLKAGKP